MIVSNKNVQRLKGIQVQIKDTVEGKSKSFTVHGISIDKLFYRLFFYSQQLCNYKEVKLICRKEEFKNGEDEIIE